LLVYSPDGRSFASRFFDTIVIWDIQTDGVAKEIKCRWAVDSMVWSLDGRMVAITLGPREGALSLEKYEVTSDTQLFKKEIEPGVAYQHLWAHRETFRLMTIPSHHHNTPTFDVSIFEIGVTLIKIESFVVTSGLGNQPIKTTLFSPPLIMFPLWVALE
jgi:hypothetical protein